MNSYLSMGDLVRARNAGIEAETPVTTVDAPKSTSPDLYNFGLNFSGKEAQTWHRLAAMQAQRAGGTVSRLQEVSGQPAVANVPVPPAFSTSLSR